MDLMAQSCPPGPTPAEAEARAGTRRAQTRAAIGARRDTRPVYPALDLMAIRLAFLGLRHRTGSRPAQGCQNVFVTSTAKKILDEALALPEDDRRRVAERLLDTIPRETAEEIERAWNEEAVRRAAALERGEVQALDGEESVRGLEEKLRSIHRG